MMRPKNAAELGQIDVELKEAVGDALVNMITRRASGTDEAGRVVYGRSPQRSVFSGQLLPRLSDGNVDDTSDIRIAAIGLDFNMDANATCVLEATPKFSIYVRVLPTWEEISSDRFGIPVEFKLRKEKKSEIDRKIKERREELFERENLGRPDWNALEPDQREHLKRRRTEIQDDVRRSVYGEYGIKIGEADSRIFESPDFSASEAEDDPAVRTPADEAGTEPTPDLGRLVTSGASIPESMYSPAQIPPKWVRIDFDLPKCTWTADLSGDVLTSVFVEHSRTMQAAIKEQLDKWQVAHGKTAWKDRTVTQADAASEESWNCFIDRVSNEKIDPRIFPNLTGVVMRVERQHDFMDPTRVSVRITLDNSCAELSKADARVQCNAIFGTGFTLRFDRDAHRPVKLDRVVPSYRFREYMAYPAIGLNCGVEESDPLAAVIELSTTWAPRFNQPRVVPRKIENLEYRFRQLAEGYDAANLLVLVQEYRSWIDQQEIALKSSIIQGLTDDDADRERVRFAEDLAGQRTEARHIEQGVQILIASREAFMAVAVASGQEKERLIRKSAPWNAWVMMNESFARRDAKDPKRGWRLFQLAFILAHIPTFASRMDEFAEHFDAERDEMSASLLYFPTGGGKSEAFYGALVFAIFLDRLRGKDRGISAMIRYPLRLLTLQQAQRLLKLIVWSEIVRKEGKAGSWPIEIGFWVGASNTPNRFHYMKPDLPDLASSYEEDAFAHGKGADAERYQNAQASYNKVPSCPCCGKATGLRRHKSDGGKERAVIVCFDVRCEWNMVHGGITPLPFLLTDDTIYQRAPAILLGTVDKLAMLGQSTRTITDILGMFGLARWIGADGHLENPSEPQELSNGPSRSGAFAAYPAYDGGKRIFHDPFPSLIIQDEAHLLEESLGTFSGLFDTLLETTFRSIDGISGKELKVARYPDRDGRLTARLPKVIAATATISDPDRQIKALYQRRPLRYPYPGPDIYRSFFSEPAKPPEGNIERCSLAQTLPRHLTPEATAPLMRLYVSLMTNGATHTVTTVGVLSSFHTIITHLWQDLLDPGRAISAAADLTAAVSPSRAGGWRRAAIQRAVDEGRVEEIMALVDLHRIALAYVTNKKGGDQVIDALHTAVAQKHVLAGLPYDRFISRLISGGIDMQEIQAVMKLAESSFDSGEYPHVGETLRNIVATSAISHGVDVDRFNSMFFAGLPSDIAEYIQASSRVGRTHVGFVMLLPTPQSRRDRYVVETHDIFHRFLERMIAPPAVERWSEMAIDRVRPSYVQTWAMLKDARDFRGLPDERKSEFVTHDSTSALSRLSRKDTLAFANDVGEFMLEAMGIGGRGQERIGEPQAREFYRARTDAAATVLGKSMKELDIKARLRQFWEEQDTKLQMPMTSLRDVDEAGLIRASDFDRGSRGTSRETSLDDVATAMKIIRRQRGDAAETDVDFDQVTGE